MKELKLHTPLDRDYFKYKDNPRKRKTRFTDCCGLDEDHKMIENHIQDSLTDYPSTEAITPVSCKVCGRFLRYQSTLNDKAWRN